MCCNNITSFICPCCCKYKALRFTGNNPRQGKANVFVSKIKFRSSTPSPPRAVWETKWLQCTVLAGALQLCLSWWWWYAKPEKTADKTVSAEMKWSGWGFYSASRNGNINWRGAYDVKELILFVHHDHQRRQGSSWKRKCSNKVAIHLLITLGNCLSINHSRRWRCSCCHSGASSWKCHILQFCVWNIHLLQPANNSNAVCDSVSAPLCIVEKKRASCIWISTRVHLRSWLSHNQGPPATSQQHRGGKVNVYSFLFIHPLTATARHSIRRRCSY